MTAKLRKRPYTDPELGMYEVTGTVAGLKGPGRRKVIELELRRLDGDDLSVLAPFEQLQRLRIERSRSLDLRTLPRRPGLELTLDRVADVDLGALGGRDDLDGFCVLHLGDHWVPDRFELPTRMRELAVHASGPAGAERAVRLIDALDWSRLARLKSLELRIDGIGPLASDLRWLGELAELEHLEILGDLQHSGPGVSPLDPPFEGLSRQLTSMRIEAPDPAERTAALQRHFGRAIDPLAEFPSVLQRPGPAERGPESADERSTNSWRLNSSSDDGWSVYGSFADLFDDDSLDEEYEAMKEARRRVAAQDAALEKRLEFDHESDGTGVYAERREDLQKMLELLDIERA